MTIVTADPASARSLRNRAKPSTTKLPLKVTRLPAGSQTTMAPARSNIRTAPASTPLVARSPRNTPTISSSMAPMASTISGKAGSSVGIPTVSLIVGFEPWSMRQEGGSLGRSDGALVILEKLRNRSRREFDHRLRVDAEQNRQGDQRTKRDDLAVVEVLDRSQARLGQRAEDDLAVKPQRVDRREDGSGGHHRRHPGIDAEPADKGEEFPDETGGAGQPQV